MLSSVVDWECVGVTHEYWTEAKQQSSYTGQVRASKITTLVINDKEDGGCKTDKFIRDEKLLREGLADPTTSSDLKTRYKFYLAQTLKDTQKFEESIVWCNRRIEDAGWPEEVYYSKFQVGINYEHLAFRKQEAAKLLKEQNPLTEKSLEFLALWNKDNLSPDSLINESVMYFNKAEESYLEAYKFRKTRAESLYRLVRLLRIQGKNFEAMTHAIEGKKIVYPKEDTLFIEAACYDYLFDFELGIVAYYVNGKKDLGRESVIKLIDRSDLPEQYKETIVQISRWYL